MNPVFLCFVHKLRMLTESSNLIHIEMYHGALRVDSWYSRSSDFVAAGVVDSAAGSHNCTATDNRFAIQTN